MNAASLSDLHRRIGRLLERLEEGGAPPEDLAWLLLKSDHALRSLSDRERRCRAALKEQLEELLGRLDQLSRVRDTAAFLAGCADSDAVYDGLPALLRRTFGADAASLMLLDEESGRLEFVGADLAEGRLDLRGRALGPGEGVAGWVALQGRSRLSPDTGSDPQFLPLEGGQPVAALLCAPLVCDGRVRGVVNVSRVQAGGLDEDDEHLLNLLCESIALAVDRLRQRESFLKRVEEQTRELEDVRDFFQSIVNSSDDLIVVLSPEYEMILVSTVVEDLLGVDSASLLGARLSGRLLEPDMALELERSLQGDHALRDHDIQLLHADGRPVFASVNASPIRGGTGELLGHLCIFRSIERRVRVHRELTRLNSRLNELFEAAIEIGSSLDVEQVIERVLGRILKLLEADGASVLLLTPDGRSLRRWSDEAAGEPGLLALADCPEGIVVKQQKPLLLSEPSAVRQFLPEEGPRLQSCIMVPLRVQDAVIGVLRVDSRNPDRLFDYQDLRLSSTFATQSGLAIENSRLYSTTRLESGRLRGLLDLSRGVPMLHSPVEILELFAKAALRLSGVQAVVAWEFRRSESAMRRACLLQEGLELESPERLVTAGLPDDDPLHFLVRDPERRVRYHPLPEQLPPWIPRPRQGPVALLALPVMDERDVYGVLLFYWRESGGLPEEDESFISVLAMQAAAAIRGQNLLRDNQAAREFLTSVVVSATDAIVVSDRRGRITLFNPGAEALLGQPQDKMLGRPVPEIYPDAEKVMWRLRRLGRSGQDHLTVETELRAADGGKVPVQLSLSWLRDARGRIAGILAVAKDISELKTLEKARLEAERLTGIERMAVTVSDRINTPLSVILAHMEMVRLLQPELGEAALESLRTVEEQVVRVKAILDQLNHLKNPRIKEYALPDVHMYDLDGGGEPNGEPPKGERGPESPPRPRRGRRPAGRLNNGKDA